MRPANPALERAVAAAGAAFAASGDADRRARELTADWFDPPRRNLIYVLQMYAWHTRHQRRHLPYWRAKARNAVKCYRAIRPRAVAASPMRRAA